jgi:predicted AlkP superfamily phosphohydrolase/phosphomutase
MSRRIALAALAATCLLASPAAPAPLHTNAPAETPAAGPPGLFVLGIDGVDPVILQRMIDEGQMPHFADLASDGSFQELGTSNPPQSPVAWSNFVTGMNPGGHGIYDFIHRDPRTYMPLSSATAPPSGDEPIMLEMFGLALPVAGGDEIANNRSGTPFWDLLHDAGVPVEVYRMPGNFPPTPSQARTLAGMGTDDLRALNGKYYWFTDEILFGTGELKAELTVVTREDEDGDGFAETISTSLKGPQDAMRTDPPSPYIEVPMTVHISPLEPTAWIRVGGGQTIVSEGSWSDWVEVSFDAMPMGLAPVTGMVRFYLKQVAPDFKLYVSPLNFAPAVPVTPIATPDEFTTELHDRLGNFYTQGMPEEVNALKDGLFEISDFIGQVNLVHEDGHAMLDMALDRFDRGDMTFMYLSDIDLQCHMLWHVDDPKHEDAPRHPAWTDKDASQGAGAIEEFYRGIDKALGDVRQRLPEDTVLIVMSDHGFQPYTRKVHLNTWLRDEGYLVLNGDRKDGKVMLITDHDTGEVNWEANSIDWRKTKAYALGFNGIYLNRQDRESQGIVTDAEADAVAAEIIAKLKALRDPQGGATVVVEAYTAAEAYQGTRVDEAPDIVVGFNAGYGNSEKSTLGDVVDAPVIYDNTGHDFTGNHLMDPSVVPGILLSNLPIVGSGHDLTDVTATLLHHFGVAPGSGMIGQTFLQD